MQSSFPFSSLFQKQNYYDMIYFFFRWKCIKMNFIFLTQLNERSKDSKPHRFCWKSLLLPRLKKIFHERPAFTRFRLLTKSRSIARSDISRGAVGKVDIERHGGGRWRAGVACVARVSNAQVSWQIEALCRDNGEFISGPAGATM